MSECKCFPCHKTVHCTSQCPKKKDKGKAHVATSTDITNFAVKLWEFLLVVACLASTRARSSQFADNNAWLVDSGPSCHMTEMKDVFLSVSKTDSGM